MIIEIGEIRSGKGQRRTVPSEPPVTADMV